MLVYQRVLSLVLFCITMLWEWDVCLGKPAVQKSSRYEVTLIEQ
jgi:hypothetical protein